MKTYIVYLSKNEFSVKMAKESIESLDKFNIDYSLFDGVVGNDGIKVLQDFNVKPSIHVSKWTAGTIGCLASHYILWDMCSKQNEPFLILEQDGILLRDPRKIIDEVDKICHLDSTNPFDLQRDNHIDFYNSRAMLDVPGVSDYPNNTFYPNNKIIPKGCFRGTYGYLLKPEGAKEIIEWTQTHGCFPSDGCLNHHATKLQRANSTYVRLNPFFSTLKIQGEYSLRNPKNKI